MKRRRTLRKISLIDKYFGNEKSNGKSIRDNQKDLEKINKKLKDTDYFLHVTKKVTKEKTDFKTFKKENKGIIERFNRDKDFLNIVNTALSIFEKLGRVLKILLESDF